MNTERDKNILKMTEQGVRQKVVARFFNLSVSRTKAIIAAQRLKNNAVKA